MGSISVSAGFPNASVDRSQMADALRATAHISESMPRGEVGANLTGLVSGQLKLQAIYLPPGRTVTNLIFLSGGTALGTPTNWWFALYTSGLSLLSQTADQTSTAWAANFMTELALGTPQAITVGGLYYVGICCVGGTMPTLVGVSHQGDHLIGQAPILHGRSTTGLTGTAPATAAAITREARTCWCAVS